MKKGLKYFLYFCAVAVLAFTLGFLIGRNANHAPVVLQGVVTETVSEEYIEKGKININTATVETLDVLPGIGPALAQRIIDYRQEYGPFTHIQQLTNVYGIGPDKIKEMEAFITVGG